MRILAFGDAAVLCTDLDPSTVLPRYAGLLASRPRAITDIVPAQDTIVVRFDPDRTDAATTARWIRSAGVGVHEPGPTGVHTVPVRYDGVDLDAVAEVTGVSAEAVVDAHTRAEWTVAFLGFAPGFGYLVPDGPGPDIARHATPRPLVPAGAVALAGRYSAVYPRSSPGGWRIIGRTGHRFWNEKRDPPALLAPGDRVRFRATR